MILGALLAPIMARAMPMLPAAALAAGNFWRAAPPAPGVPPTALASLPQQRLYVLQAGALVAACDLPPMTPSVAPEATGCVFGRLKAAGVPRATPQPRRWRRCGGSRAASWISACDRICWRAAGC